MFRDVTLIQNFFLGMLLPLVIAFINQCRWPATVKGIVALLVCVISAVVVEVLRGDITFVDWGSTIVVVLTTAFGFYKVLWQPSEIAPRIERATSVGGDRPVV